MAKKVRFLIVFIAMIGVFVHDALGSSSKNFSPIPSVNAKASQPQYREKITGRGVNVALLSYEKISELKQDNQLDKARIQAKKYLKKYPHDVDMQLLLGSIYYQMQSYDQADQVLQQGLDEAPAYLDIRYLLIKTKIAQKKHEEALVLADKGLEYHPYDKRLQAEKQKAYNHIHRQHEIKIDDKKIKIIEKSAPPAPKGALTYSFIKKIYDKKDYAQVEQLSLRYLQQYPKDIDVRLLLAKSHEKQDKFLLAEKEYLEILKVNANDKVIRMTLINLDLREKQYRSALALIKAGLAIDPEDKDLLYKKAVTYYLLGDYRKSETILKFLAKKDPNDTKVKKILNDIDASQGWAFTKKTRSEKVTYAKINDQFKRGNLNRAKLLAINYLQSHPSDTDVRYILARVYIAQHKLVYAIKELNKILTKNPRDEQARIMLINLNIRERQYSQAIDEINIGLVLAKNPQLFLSKRATIYYLQGDYQHAAKDLKAILAINPYDENANKLLDQIILISPKDGIGPNIVGISLLGQHVSDLKSFWGYSSAFYGRETDYGLIMAKINYADRLSQNSPQGEIEAFPVIRDNMYLDLDFAYANNRRLFPRYAYAAEAYISEPDFVDVSFGAKYNDIDHTYFTTYTGSVSKQFDKNWLSFRPYHYVPKAGNTSTLYTATYRRYFNTPDLYWDFSFGAGDSPDLNDLDTVDFIKVDERIYSTAVRCPIMNHHVLLDIGINYQKQRFPSGVERELVGALLGVTKRF